MTLATGICDREMTAATAPAWVHLLPSGPMTGRDGRRFVLAEPEALVLAFQSAAIDLPVDYEHQNDRPEARLSGPVPAAGWIKELMAEADGIWGRVEWTARAREMIGRREYRFLSPAFLHHPQTREIVRLKGAGLVHNPNLLLTALARQEDAMIPDPKPPSDLRQSLAAILGLAENTTDDDLLAEVSRLKRSGSSPRPDSIPEVAVHNTAPDPHHYVATETMLALLVERIEGLIRLTAARAEEKVAVALRTGHISPAMKDWALALCRSDESSFDAYLARLPPAFGHLLESSHATAAPPGDRIAPVSPDALAICAQLCLAPNRLD